MNKLSQVAILIPAHNEEKVIEKTFKSMAELVPINHIYIVNDGSSDKTNQIARSLTANVLTKLPGVGKATALNSALEYFDIINRYEYVMPMDADTIITRDFFKNALPVLKNDNEHKIACVVGKVTGINSCFVTSFRIWEYEIAQAVHKRAQSIEDAVMICPGCSTIYRAEIFKEVRIPTGTLTEDMDLTFLIHRKKLGRIVYVGNSKVVTQDPNTLKDYFKQLDRWYLGFWQCLLKHNVPWGGQLLDLEVLLIAMEGLFNGILVICFIFLVPIIFKFNPMILAVPASVDLLLFLIPTMLYAGLKNDIFHILLYVPQFYFLRFMSSLIFLKSFIMAVASQDLRIKGAHWNMAKRY